MKFRLISIFALCLSTPAVNHAEPGDKGYYSLFKLDERYGTTEFVSDLQYGDFSPIIYSQNLFPEAYAEVHSHGRILSLLGHTNDDLLKTAPSMCFIDSTGGINSKRMYGYFAYSEWLRYFERSSDAENLSATVLPGYLILSGERPEDVAMLDARRPYIIVRFKIYVIPANEHDYKLMMATGNALQLYLDFALAGYPGSDTWPYYDSKISTEPLNVLGFDLSIFRPLLSRKKVRVGQSRYIYYLGYEYGDINFKEQNPNSLILNIHATHSPINSTAVYCDYNCQYYFDLFKDIFPYDETLRPFPEKTAFILIGKSKVPLDLDYAGIPLPTGPSEPFGFIDTQYIVKYGLDVSGITHDEEGDELKYHIARGYFRDPLALDGSQSGVLDTSDTVVDGSQIKGFKRQLAMCNEVVDEGRYTINSNGTVADKYHGLMWQRCPLGYVINDNATPNDYYDDICVADGSDTQLSWSNALQKSQENTLAEHTNWRLPNIKELETIIAACKAPTIELFVYPDTPANIFWTNSPVVNQINVGENTAWHIDFSSGNIDFSAKSSLAYARLVRDSSTAPIAPQPAIHAGTVKVVEGDNSDTRLTYLPVYLDKPAKTDISIDVTIKTTAATEAIDFLPFSSSTITIPAGETHAQFPVTIVGDNDLESNESIIVQLSSQNSEIRMARPLGVISILDDEPLVILPRTVMQGEEGDSGSDGTLEIPVTLSKPVGIGQTVTVDYDTSDEDVEAVFKALDGTDYHAKSGTLIFTTGEIEKIITIDLIGNNVEQNDNRKFKIRLTNPVQAKFNTAKEFIETEVLIVDDDGDQTYRSTYTGINDTGLTICSNGTNTIACGDANYPRQDADVGLDVGATDDDGVAGQSLTKYTYTYNGTDVLTELPEDTAYVYHTPGNSPSDEEPNPVTWECVKDNTTGLYWEVKLPKYNSSLFPRPDWWPESYREGYASFNWYNTTTINDGDYVGESGQGDPDDGQCSNGELVARCDETGYNTENYLTYLNSYAGEGLCGFSDWRLPTASELQGLLSYRHDSNVLDYDTLFFPNQLITHPTSNTIQGTWSTSHWIIGDGRANGSLAADPLPYAFLLNGGGMDLPLGWAKNINNLVRLVRGAKQ